MDDEDIIMPDEEVDIPTTEETGAEEQPKQEVDQPKAEEVQENEDEKFLEYINKKGLIKFNGENVAVKDINDLVTNYQKRT